MSTTIISYRSALQVIADLVVNEDTDCRAVLAMCIAIAHTALALGDKANDRLSSSPLRLET